MSNKLSTILAAVLLTVIFACNAMAAFVDLQLFRVVYERATGTVELATDLGAVKGIVAASSTVKAGSLPTVTNANNLFVSYFALDRTTNEFWVSGTDPLKPPVAVGTLGFNTYKSGTTSFYSLYTVNGLSPDANGVFTGLQSNANSHRLKLTANQGALSNAVNIATRVNTEANLAGLVNGTASSVQQYLYYFVNGNTANSTGVPVATITTNSDGSTTISNAVNSVCGSSHDRSLSVAPTTNLCAISSAIPAVTGSGPWSWTCSGINGGADTTCTASLLPPAVDGVCGPAHGVAVSTIPTTGLCTSGTASSVNGTGPWTWDCAGQNGGANAPCSADVGKAAPVITWATPAPITYGTPLSAAQLNATADVSGSFQYTPALDTIPNSGTQTLSVTFTPTDTVTYDTVTSTVTLTVNPAVLTVAADNLSKRVNTDNPSLTYSISGFVNGEGVEVLNGTAALSTTAVTSSPAGVYPISVAIGTLAANNYSFNLVDANLTVDPQLLPVITWNAPAAITYGTPLSPTQLNATADVPGTFTYTPAAGAVLNAGTQTLSATFTPTDAVNYASVTSTVPLTISKATPVITWAAPSAITYGTPLSGTQLNATAGVPGTFAYTPALNSVLNAGTHTLSVTFTPTDTVNYTTATATVNLTVNKATLTVTAGNLTRTVDTANPPLTHTITGFVNNEGAGVLSGSPLLSTAALINSPVGDYPISVTAGTLAAANYSFSFVSGTLTVTSLATPIISWATPAAITYGTPLSASQLNATASVPGTFAYTPAEGSVPDAGTQTLSVTFTPTDTATFASVSATVSLTVSKAVPVITWTAPAAITYGTSLSVAQLNATASVPGTFVYTPAAGAVLNAGSQSLSVTFTPTDTANFTPATATVSLTVNKAVLTITADNTTKMVNTANPPLTYAVSGYVNGEGVAVLNGTAPLLNTTALLNSPAGTYPVSVAAGTLAATNYSFIFVNGTLTVNPQLLPVITWTAPAATVYGTPLSDTQLNATATVPGTFLYTPAAGSVLSAGTHNLSVTFTPSDSATYTTVTSSIVLTVNKAVLTVTADNKSKRVNTANPEMTYSVNGYVNGEGDAVLNGTTPALSTTALTNSPVGDYPISITAGSLAAANYSFIFVGGTLAITPQSLPVISWKIPVAITYGTPLSAAQLNATANVPGTFAYAPAVGNLPNAGTQALFVTFIPDDSVNYSAAGATVNLNVNKATPTITWAAPAAIVVGTPLSSVQLNALASVPGTLTYSPAPDSVPGAGSQTLSVSFIPTDTTNHAGLTATVTLQVNYPSGDVNGDGKTDLSDALRVLRYTIGFDSLTDLERKNVDVAPLVAGKPNPDKTVDLGDALIILKKVVGIVTW